MFHRMLKKLFNGTRRRLKMIIPLVNIIFLFAISKEKEPKRISEKRYVIFKSRLIRVFPGLSFV